MRAAGFALVMLSVLLSSAGVTIRSSAESQDAQMSLLEPAQEPERAAIGFQPMCMPHTPVRRQIALPFPEGEKAVPLNGRGYNYARPGEHQPTPPAPAANAE